MFAQAYQSGYISILYSIGSKPLQLWEKHAKPPGDGVRRVLDDDIQSAVIEISADGTEIDGEADADALISTLVRCPARGVAESLDIRLPQLVFQLKPMQRRHLAIEVHVRDHLNELRRFRLATYQRATVVHQLLTLLPLHLDNGVWNQLQLDLPKLTLEAYGSRYVHTTSVQIHAHCRVRRVFFADRVVPEHELPMEFRLHKRLSKQRMQQLKTES